MLKKDQRVGEYVLVKMLGAGGFGGVWLARNATPGKKPTDVALKVLHAGLLDTPRIKDGPTPAERFLAEADLIQRLDHPGIVRIHSVVRAPEQGVVAYAMELLHGCDLNHLAPHLDLETLLELFAQTADTLDYLHEQSVIHRDIKPENIFICDPEDEERTARVKLIDFGIAKELYAQSLLDSTATGYFMGTVRSMPPESFSRWVGNVELSPAVDQWAMGVTMYLCLTGKVPFEDRALPRLITKIERDPTPPLVLHPRFGLPSAPPEIERVIARCLEKDPDKRYPRTKELAAALRAARTAIMSANLETDVDAVLSETLVEGKLGRKRAPLGKKLAAALVHRSAPSGALIAPLIAPPPGTPSGGTYAGTKTPSSELRLVAPSIPAPGTVLDTPAAGLATVPDQPGEGPVHRAIAPAAIAVLILGAGGLIAALWWLR